MNDTYWDGLNELNGKYINLYKEHRETFILLLAKTDAPLSILMTMYNKLVWDEILTPIENIPQPEKSKYWNQVKEYDREKAIKMSKVIYAIEFVIRG